MHRKYAPDGLVCVSTDIMPSELKAKGQVLGFLRGMNATFPNYIFNDSPKNAGAWSEKYGIDFTPATLLYDRRGQRHPLPLDADHEAVEAAVRSLLAEK